MKKSWFTEEQITYALRLADSGMPVAEVCREIGISEATYYTWKKKYADWGVTELRRLKTYPYGHRSVESRERVTRGELP